MIVKLYLDRNEECLDSCLIGLGGGVGVQGRLLTWQHVCVHTTHPFRTQNKML